MNSEIDKEIDEREDDVFKDNKLMRGVGIWISFYRLFPHLFVEQYLGIYLKPFQKILIYFMMRYNFFMYIASRGQGKSFLTAIFCATRCILFPESKIILAAGNKSQAIEILEKLLEMKPNCPNLFREIEEIKTGSNDARCVFKNGSWIRVVASNQGARSKRANVIVVDEFVQVKILTHIFSDKYMKIQ